MASTDLFDEKIEIVKQGCPICHSDVAGNDMYLYLCKRCRILFKKEHLELSKVEVEKLVKDAIIKKAKPIRMDEKIPIKEHKYYIVTKKTQVLHVNNCPFAKNIKSGTKYKDLESATYDKKCKCAE